LLLEHPAAESVVGCSHFRPSVAADDVVYPLPRYLAGITLAVTSGRSM
jgi:hypothetical protein